MLDFFISVFGLVARYLSKTFWDDDGCKKRNEYRFPRSDGPNADQKLCQAVDVWIFANGRSVISLESLFKRNISFFWNKNDLS